MLKRVIVLFLFALVLKVSASEHGIYLKTNQNIKIDFKSTVSVVLDQLKTDGFLILNERKLASPDLVIEDIEDKCGYESFLIVFTSNEYIKTLTSYGNKYLVASFLKASVYQDENGIQINITDPETINRIVFNDLYENEELQKYGSVIKDSKVIKKKVLASLHATNLGDRVETPMEPIRSNEDLAESSRDMFMMVGPMTFFNDEDQFPMIYETSTKSVEQVKSMFEKNIAAFTPTEEDVEYRLAITPEVLKWEIICEAYSTDQKALLLGISRSRTEAVSFQIAGSSRESDANMCPGIDHTAAYPIEVMIIEEEGKVKVYTAREMFRMDMYFWDAGMNAFMNHMSMPAILDESIGRALLGNEYIDD